MIKSIKTFFSSKKPLIEISGVYFGENRYLRIVQQPVGSPEFVSEMSGVATSFQSASHFGTIGLIAHNFLGGRFFLELNVGDEIHVLDGFGRSRCYRVSDIRQFQALEPRSPRSQFIDLENQQTCTASEVFKEIYTGEHRLILQTCIEKGQIKEWGRQFVIAEPIKE